MGAHAVVLVSKNSVGYRFANTWGTEWGDNGFGILSEAAARVLTEQGGGQLFAIEVIKEMEP